MKTFKIKFLVDTLYKTQPPVTYTAGQILECSRESADHWIRRNKAVELKDGACDPEVGSFGVGNESEPSDSGSLTPSRKKRLGL